MRGNMKTDQSIFKAYDIRGIYPTQLDEETFYRLGWAYAEIIKPTKPVVVGCDVRLSSPVLKESLINGLTDAGIDVVDIGLVSTEMYYFAVGNYGYGGGIQVTASHNPAEWNGAKMIKEGVVPLSKDSGLFEIRDLVLSNKEFINNKVKGSITKKDVLDDFCHHLLTWINPKKIKPFKVVYNPNFGYEGIVFKRLAELGSLQLELVPLNAEPDGNFPKGRPDPYIPENRVELVEMVRSKGADLGVAWDADADRVFFCADGGLFIDSYYANTLLIKKMLEKYPGGKIIYDPRCTWATIEAIKSNGGVPLIERVGHSFIKARMRKEGAVFSGENSGHTYYQDFWFADSGLIPLMQILELMSETEKKLSDLIAPVLNKYFISGEINFTVENANEIMGQIAEHYKEADVSGLDGIACEFKDWRFSLRGSNTEPLLRLNVESRDKELLNRKVVELKELIETK